MQHSPEPIPEPRIDPYPVAYLVGGPSRAIETAVVALLQHGLVSLRFDGRCDVLVSQSAPGAPPRLACMESTMRERIHRAGTAGVIPALLLRENNLAASVAMDLRRRGLVAPPDSRGKPWKLLLLGAVMLVILAIAFVPGLLVPLGGAALMIWIGLPGIPPERVLPAGHELVARARGATAPARTRRGSLADTSTEGVVLAVACHGTSVLTGGPHALLHQAIVDPPREARPVGEV